jgi:hypothetical protein
MDATMRLLNITAPSLIHKHTLQLAGAHCELRTNCSRLAATLDRWLAPDNNDDHHFGMQVLVVNGGNAVELNAHFRGMRHIVVASFGQSNLFVFDLLRRNIFATVSESVVRDSRFWNDVLLPIAIGVLGASIGIAPVHCACLSSEGDGLLLAGVSGAGKSTLTAALAQSGFDYVSDDWTYFSQDSETLMAHGMAARMKLMPDAIVHFPRLAAYSLGTSLNGELAYEVAAEVFGSRVKRFSQPRWGVFVERVPHGKSEFTPLSGRQASDYLESSVERLPTQLTTVAQHRAGILDQVATLPWWRFRYNGTPQFAARELQEFVAQQRQLVTP